MTNWYTADPHFGHENIIGFCSRPFRDLSEMHATLISNYAGKVGPDDDLWIIGDFAFGQSWQDDTPASLFERIPGRKHLIIGNHDGKATLALPWTSIADLREIKDGRQRLVLCHYPMITWNGARHGSLQLFGHVHDSWQGTRNSLNVGVDVWNFMPVTIDDVKARAAELPINKHWADAEHGASL